jgi:hypothetical protein
MQRSCLAARFRIAEREPESARLHLRRQCQTGKRDAKPSE